MRPRAGGLAAALGMRTPAARTYDAGVSSSDCGEPPPAMMSQHQLHRTVSDNIAGHAHARRTRIRRWGFIQ